MKKASQEKAHALRTPRAPQGNSKPVKPVVMQDEPYEAKVLGQARAVLRAWTPEGNLSLADGTEFVFEPLVKPSFGFRSRALHSVASLELTDDGWDEDGLGEDRWLLNGENCLSRDAVNALADKNDPDAFRFLILRAKLQSLDDEASHSVCAVAWFAPTYALKGQDEPVLLREFYRVQTAIKEPPASPPSEKHERELCWWHDSEITNIKGTTKRGKEFVVPISPALREVLQLLLEQPGEPVPLARLKDRVNQSRDTAGYRAAKILDSAEAKELHRVGVLKWHKAPGGKLVSYSVVPPSNPVS